MKCFPVKGTIWLTIGALVMAGCGFKGGPTASADLQGRDIPGSAGTTIPLTKVRIGLDATFPPFESVDTSKREIVGFDVDLMNAVAEKAGLEVEFVSLGFKQVLSGITQCQLDGGISAIAITDELRQQVSFSNPYFTNGQVVVVKTGNITITGWDKLSGTTVGTQAGSPSVAEVEKIQGVQMKAYVTYDLAFLDLTQGLVDAVIVDKLLASNYVRIKSNNLKIVGDEFARESYAIAICSQKLDLLTKINDGLEAVKADGTLDKLVEKWLGISSSQ